MFPWITPFSLWLSFFPIRRKLLRFSHHLSSSHGGRGLWLLRPWTIVAFLCNDIQTSGLKTETTTALPAVASAELPPPPEKNKTVRSCIIHARERCKKLSERIAATSSLKENAPPRLGSSSTSKQPPASLAARLCVFELRMQETFSWLLPLPLLWFKEAIELFKKKAFLSTDADVDDAASENTQCLAFVFQITDELRRNVRKDQATYPQFSRISGTWMDEAKKCTCKKIGREKSPPGQK